MGFEPPKVNSLDAEKEFSRAYRAYAKGDHFQAIEALSEALGFNIYLVDTYLLRGMALRRLGALDAAEEAVENYLEVRHGDETGERFAAALQYERKLVEESIRGSEGFHLLIGRKLPFKTYFRLPLSVNISPSGLGKIKYGFGVIYICDAVGGRLWAMRETSPAPISVEVDAPQTVLPIDEAHFYLINRRGEIMEGTIDWSSGLLGLSPLGNVGGIVGDGSMFSPSEIVIGDCERGELLWVSMPKMEITKRWKTKSGRMEPVSVVTFGEAIAIADRANERCIAIDGKGAKEIAVASVPLPRDIAWIDRSTLSVLGEDGSLREIVLRKDTVEAKASLADPLTDAWSIVESKGALLVFDVRLSSVWEIFPMPEEGKGLVFSVCQPGLSEEAGEATFELRGHLALKEALQNLSNPHFFAAWNGHILPVKASLSQNEAPVVLLLGSASSGQSVPVVPWDADFDTLLRRIYETVGGWPTDLILESSEELKNTSMELKKRFLSFCLFNGVRASLLAKDMPSAEWVQICKFTGGDVIWNVNSHISGLPPLKEWLLSIHLPPNNVPSGQIGEATLALYGHWEARPFRDWFPLWPNLLQSDLAAISIIK